MQRILALLHLAPTNLVHRRVQHQVDLALKAGSITLLGNNSKVKGRPNLVSRTSSTTHKGSLKGNLGRKAGSTMRSLNNLGRANLDRKVDSLALRDNNQALDKVNSALKDSSRFPDKISTRLKARTLRKANHRTLHKAARISRLDSSNLDSGSRISRAFPGHRLANRLSQPTACRTTHKSCNSNSSSSSKADKAVATVRLNKAINIRLHHPWPLIHSSSSHLACSSLATTRKGSKVGLKVVMHRKQARKPTTALNKDSNLLCLKVRTTHSSLAALPTSQALQQRKAQASLSSTRHTLLRADSLSRALVGKASNSQATISLVDTMLAVQAAMEGSNKEASSLDSSLRIRVGDDVAMRWLF